MENLPDLVVVVMRTAFTTAEPDIRCSTFDIQPDHSFSVRPRITIMVSVMLAQTRWPSPLTTVTSD